MKHRDIPTKQIEMTYEVWPDSVFKTINKMPNPVGGYREPKSTIAELKHMEIRSQTTQTTL
jgi:hypothetical protein